MSGALDAVTILLSTIGDDDVCCYVLSVLEVGVALLVVWSARTWPERSPDTPAAGP